MKKSNIEQQRSYSVVKANELIQKSRFQLSLPEQKTVAYICSLIQPGKREDTYQLEYNFNIRDYAKICGIDYDSGRNYAEIKKTLKHLSDRSMWVDFGNEEVLCRWLSKVRIKKKSGIVSICIDADLAPYLFNLGKNFTEYQLFHVLNMKSAFSFRLYEILKSYLYKDYFEKTFHIDELKLLLAVEKVPSYDRFPDFRRKVIDKAVSEINDQSDLRVTYDTTTKGRKVTHITFRITRKTPLERLLCEQSANDKLNKK